MNEVVTVSRKDWGWLLVSGILFIIFGVIAFSMPVASTVGVMVGLASLLIASGVVHFIYAFKVKGMQGRVMRFVQAIVSVFAGFLMFRHPVAGMIWVLLALSFYFFVGAASQWILASETPSHRGLLRVGAVVSFLLGVFMIVTSPFSALWMPGLLLGIDFVFFGATLVGLALANHTAHEAESGTPTGQGPLTAGMSKT